MKSSIKVIACISTPLQYINLLELIDYLGVSQSNCVLIVYSHNKNTLNQINDISYIKEWEQFIVPFTINQKFWVISFIWLRLLFFYYKKRIKIVGNIADIKNRFLINLSKNISYVVDDGANSILINRLISDKILSRSNRLNLIIEAILFKRGHKLKSQPFIFFTIYKNLIIDNRIMVVINNFTCLKKKYFVKASNKRQVNELWFIGAHFVKLGMIEQVIYKKILAAIKIYAETNKLKFLYFGHRSELEFNDDLFEDIEIQANLMPFELYVMQSEIEPKIIGSFYSSSLFNLLNLIPDKKIISFNLLNQNILVKNEFKENLKIIYDYIKENSEIELIEIPNLDIS